MILDEIVARKREDLARRQAELPLLELERLASRQGLPLDFAAVLRGDGMHLIAEVKKASPSKGLLSPNFDPVALARTYAQNGAVAISVLTEGPHFQGSLEDLAAIEKVLGPQEIPLLRKDFVVHPYQVYESRAFGADALLLIVAILSDEELRELLSLSHELGMECLVEVHDEVELERALRGEAKIIGINNRDLTTFSVDIATTERLRPMVPPDRLVVSESGIKSRQEVLKLRRWGVNAVLVGEALVTATDVAARVRELS